MDKKTLYIILAIAVLFIIYQWLKQPQNGAVPGIRPISGQLRFIEGPFLGGNVLLMPNHLRGFTYLKEAETYKFTFYLTPEGQKIFTEATQRLAAQNAVLSIWLGEECLLSPKVVVGIPDAEFIVPIPSVTDQNLEQFVERLSKQIIIA